jgi:hypothetical protein
MKKESQTENCVFCLHLQFTLTLPEKDLVAPHKSYTLNVTKDLVPMHIFSEAPQGISAVVHVLSLSKQAQLNINMD